MWPTDVWGSSNRAVLQNQYANSVERTIDLSAQAAQGQKEIIQEETTSAKEVARILAEGQRAAQVLEAAKSESASFRTQQLSRLGLE
jgi:hypothetical protein